MKCDELDIGYQGMVYLTVGKKENCVPSILGGANYDYHYPSIDYEFESCYLGFLNENKGYENFASFENHYVPDALRELREQYEKASSLDYFNSLKGLSNEYKKLKDSYDKLKSSSSKIDYRKEPAKSYLGFAHDHHEIIADFDIRFSHLGHYITYEDSQDGVVGKLVTFEPKPEISYEEYSDFLKEFYKNKENEICIKYNDELKSIKRDYQSFIEDLKKLLSEYEKVGIVYLSLSTPKRLIGKEVGTLDNLDIDVYLKMQANRIYWVKRG